MHLRRDSSRTSWPCRRLSFHAFDRDMFRWSTAPAGSEKCWQSGTRSSDSSGRRRWRLAVSCRGMQGNGGPRGQPFRPRKHPASRNPQVDKGHPAARAPASGGEDIQVSHPFPVQQRLAPCPCIRGSSPPPQSAGPQIIPPGQHLGRLPPVMFAGQAHESRAAECTSRDIRPGKDRLRIAVPVVNTVSTDAPSARPSGSLMPSALRQISRGDPRRYPTRPSSSRVPGQAGHVRETPGTAPPQPLPELSGPEGRVAAGDDGSVPASSDPRMFGC